MAFAQTLLRKMLSDPVPEKHYDIFFVVESRLRDGTVSDTRLGAHRVVLSAVSAKFEERATEPTNREAGPNISDIIIDDCSPAAVRESLEIIYGGDLREARHSVVLALDIWRFGVKFEVDHLIALARNSCLTNLSTDNCLRILDFAVRVNDAQIVDKLQNYASENAHFSHVISSPDFERLDFDVISSLVRPGKGECAWPEILTFEKVWFDALIKWLTPRVHRIGEANGEQVGREEIREEKIGLVEKVLALVDFSRMKTHELRDVSKNEIACLSPTFSHVLVDVLLTRSEQLEASILERNIDLDVIGQKYQQALCEQDEAERKARAAFEKMDKLQTAKVTLEKRIDDIRRKKTAITDSSGPASLNSARRKMSGSSTII